MDLHVLSLGRLLTIAFAATVGLSLSAPATPAAIEFEICTGESAPAAATAAAVKQAVDWTSLFLGEFAAGGPADRRRAATTRAALSASDCLQSLQFSLREVAVVENEPSLQTADREGANVDHEAAASDADRSAYYEHAWDTRAWRGASQVFRAPPSRPLAARPGGAAGEIMKLRRMVGKSPVAGTIFDAPHRDAVAWIGDVAAPSQSELSNEETMAEAIRRLEIEESMVVEQPPRVMSGAPPAQWACDLLRPAERKLEEAAEMLEQLGEYERADAARDLARRPF